MKLCVIGAMEEEIVALKERMQNCAEKSVANQTFITGSLEGKELVLLKSGVGKVNAAVGTTLAIQLYQPTHVINIGSAGGFSGACSIGDLIVSSEVRYHDVDLTVFGYEYGQASKMPASFTPDQHLLEITESCVKLLPGVSIKKGLITSGDSFVTTHQQISKIKSNFSEVHAAEMEACAIAHVCYLFKIPFIIFRFISDLVDVENNQQTHEDNLQSVAEEAAKLITCIVSKL